MGRTCGVGLGVGLWALLAVCLASTASAQVGEPIVEIQLDEEGRVVNDPAVIRLIETRVGDRLSVRSARETIAHLMSLSRYEDVRVLSEPVSGGVRVKYVLIPQHPIDRVQFTGTVALSEDDLRRVISERFGNAPSCHAQGRSGRSRAARVPDAGAIPRRR